VNDARARVRAVMEFTLVGGLMAIVAGVFCYKGFAYIASLCDVAPPTILGSIGIVFIFRQVHYVLSGLRFLDKE